MRAGTRSLALLATPLNAVILRQLSEGSKRLIDLRRACGTPAQTTLRAHLRELEGAGAIAKRKDARFPGALEYELLTAGGQLLYVADALERWLRQTPENPLTFGSNEGKAAIKALMEGWSSTMLRALAAAPLSLTELDGLITGISYPSLERRLSAMRLAGQIEPRASDGSRGTPYGVTDWVRRGIAPLAAAARWERLHLPDDTPPISRLDVEAAFLLTVPLLRLPSDLSGSCRMAAEIPEGGKRRLAGVVVEVKSGRIAACATRLEGKPDASALGHPAAWLSAVIERDGDCLELGGDCQLARTLIDGLHKALFRAAGN